MQRSDILIVGAGPAGMALAVALAQGGRKAHLVDARPANAALNDKRVLALSQGSRQILDRLGVWQQVAATPIGTIHVSQQGGFGRAVIRADDYGVDALGYVASAASLSKALSDRMRALDIGVRNDCEVTGVAPGAEDVVVSHGAGDAPPFCARLVAMAEGAVSADDDKAVVSRDYAQHAVITSATPAQSHKGVAFERFTPHGPLALLPFGADYAIVLTAPAARADQLLALDDDAFLAELQRCIGNRVRLVGLGPRARYPLQLRYRREPVGRRTVWLGNAAQTLHPVAGQGFNLALRDIWDLAAVLTARDAGHDPGSAATLAQYASERRLDRFGAIGFTDTLIRVFSNDVGVLRAARGGGLAALDMLPPLKHFIAKRMMFGARAWP